MSSRVVVALRSILFVLFGSAMALLTATAKDAYVGPLDIVVAPNQQVAYVVAYDAERIDILNVATRKVVRSIDCPARPTGLVVSGDGSTLYVTCDLPEGVVCVIDSQSGRSRRRFRWAIRPVARCCCLTGSTWLSATDS